MADAGILTIHLHHIRLLCSQNTKSAKSNYLKWSYKAIPFSSLILIFSLQICRDSTPAQVVLQTSFDPRHLVFTTYHGIKHHVFVPNFSLHFLLAAGDRSGCRSNVSGRRLSIERRRFERRDIVRSAVFDPISRCRALLKSSLELHLLRTRANPHWSNR